MSEFVKTGTKLLHDSFKNKSLSEVIRVIY